MDDKEQCQSQTIVGSPTPQARGPKSWTHLPLEHLPNATYWPAALALGVTLIFWGTVTSWVILLVGLLVLLASLLGWINDIRHERKTHPHH